MKLGLKPMAEIAIRFQNLNYFAQPFQFIINADSLPNSFILNQFSKDLRRFMRKSLEAVSVYYSCICFNLEFELSCYLPIAAFYTYFESKV